MSLDHHNHEYDGGVPNLPNAVGDRYYGQDMARDFQHLRDVSGKVMRDLFQNFPIYIGGGFVTQGVGDTLDITPAVGYVELDVDVPDSFASLPPTVKTETLTIRVESTQQTNMTVGSATLDGATTNYVKLAYDEADGASRARAKKAGSYNYEQARSFLFTVDSVAPTDDEVLLATFTGLPAGTWTITNEEPDAVKAFGASEGFMRVKFAEAVTPTDPVGIAKGNSDENLVWKCKHQVNVSEFDIDGATQDSTNTLIAPMDTPNYWLVLFTDTSNNLWWSVREWDIENGTITNIIAPANSGFTISSGNDIALVKLTGSTPDRFLIGFVASGAGSFNVRGIKYASAVLSFFGGDNIASSAGTYSDARITAWGDDYFCVVGTETGGNDIEARVGHYTAEVITWDTAATLILTSGSRSGPILSAVKMGSDTDVAIAISTWNGTNTVLGTAYFNGTAITGPLTELTILSGTSLNTNQKSIRVGKAVHFSAVSAGILYIYSSSPMRVNLSGHYDDGAIISNRSTCLDAYANGGLGFSNNGLEYLGNNTYAIAVMGGAAGDRIHAIIVKMVGQRLIGFIDIINTVDSGSDPVNDVSVTGLNGAYMVNYLVNVGIPPPEDRYVVGMIMPIFKGFPIQSYSAGDWGIIKTQGRVDGFSGLVEGQSIGVNYVDGAPGLEENAGQDIIGFAEGPDIIKLTEGAL